MATRQVQVERFSVISSKTFKEVVAEFEKAIGHPDMNAFAKNVRAAKTYDELEQIVRAATGPSELMEFTRMDLGEVLHKGSGVAARQSLRFIVGNPVIMSQMVQPVPDAGSYAPVTILIDERPDGVHLSYDRMASFLSPYGSSEAQKVAMDLDSKVERLLAAAAR
jgi:uncharacterized protein (DUF302 family)